MSQKFTVKNHKHSWEQFYIDINIASWLGTETIANVDFVAQDQYENPETANLLDAVKSTFSGTVVKPFIKAGTVGEYYWIFCKVTTNQSSKGVFILKVGVLDIPGV